MNKCFSLYLLCLTLGTSYSNAQSFTFKQGVALSHWAGNMIESYTYADPKWFNKSDVEWIARTGMDHIQVYVVGSEVITADGNIIDEKIAALDSLLGWCSDLNLGVLISPGRMPAIPTDSSLTREAQLEARLKKQVSYMKTFADHFKNYGSNLRIMINIGGDDQTVRNQYFQSVIAEIRKTNPSRKLYLMAYSINHLANLYIPENDNNIIIAAEQAQSTEAKAEPIDVFIWQHQEYYFSKNLPPVSFPGTIPVIDTLATDLGKWAVKFAGAELRKDHFETKFKAVKKWMNENHPNLELYIPYWRYWTGYPFNPATIEDKQSVQSFIRSFITAAKENDFSWCFYDYNSGSQIRYPSGEESFILKAMKLKSRKR
jgi:hypothetical protein